MSLTQHPVSPRPPGVGNKRWEKTLMESISYRFILPKHICRTPHFYFTPQR